MPPVPPQWGGWRGPPHMGLSKTASHDPLPLADFNLCFFAVINHNQLQIVLGALLVNY